MPTTYAIPNGRTVMDATTYTGNGGTITVNNSDSGTTGFKPDLVWCKDRTSALNNILMDSVRGGTQYLISNSTAAEGNGGSATINSFNTNGFTAGNGTALNTNGDAFVAWQWQAGSGTTSSNTNGSVTSTVSKNTTAGFSIVTYTGTGTTGTVGHGLGIAPSMIILKSRTPSDSWLVYHSGLPNPATNTIILNDTAAVQTSSLNWNSTSPTSSVFSVYNPGSGGYSNGNGYLYVAYCWAAIAGFSAFGSYTGNGSSSGPFIYTGFRPAFLLVKCTSDAEDWYIGDDKRNTYNSSSMAFLRPDTSQAEISTGWYAFYSNGFQMTYPGTDTNGSGRTYIYAAFAENPFKYANAR